MTSQSIFLVFWTSHLKIFKSFCAPLNQTLYLIGVIESSRQFQIGRYKGEKVDGRAKEDRLEPNWTVIRANVDGPRILMS